VDDDDSDEEAAYHDIIEEAHECHGGRDAPKSFHEEWESQLLIRCGDTYAGHRVVLFCPYFLKSVLNDPDEMDRAFRFIMLCMDDIAMHRKYIFIYCYLGVDWSNPALASRVRFAYEILPAKYLNNLWAFYILHPAHAFRLTMWTFRPMVSKRFWEKIEYVSSLDEMCAILHPNDDDRRADLKRRFPLAVHRRDAEHLGRALPVTFGVPLKNMSLYYGVDFLDHTTGKFYPRLPAALIFLCETLEREDGDNYFAVFDTEADDVYRLIDIIDAGKPVERDMPPESLWCVLKLWLDFLPSPLFSFKAIEELKRQQIKAGDLESQRGFLIDLFHGDKLPMESAYVALYLSSFLQRMCHNAIEQQDGHLLANGVPVNRPRPEEAAKKSPILARSAATVFASSFLRPRSMSEEILDVIPDAVSLVETLITCAEEPDLWIGSPVTHRQLFSEEHGDGSSNGESEFLLASHFESSDEEKGGASSSSAKPAKQVQTFRLSESSSRSTRSPPRKVTLPPAASSSSAAGAARVRDEVEKKGHERPAPAA